MTETSQKHPKGLYFIYTIAIAERFGYYGMRALFTLYMIKALLFDKDLSSAVYGNYTGLVYLTPLIGGYIADRYWGMRRSVFWGAVLMVIGQFFMFTSALMYQNVEIAKWLMYIGLGGLIFGNGFFKPNVSTFVGKLYEQGDRRLDAAYTLFYMGVNIGAFLSPIVCGFLGDTGNPADFKWGFLVAALVSVLCLVIYVIEKDKYLIGPDGNAIGILPAAKEKSETVEKAAKVHFSMKEITLWIAGALAVFSVFTYFSHGDIIGSFIYAACIAVPAFVIADKSLTKIERQRIWVIYIIAFFVIFFWSAFEQAGISLTYFAEEQTNRNILGWTMPASWFQSFNAVFVVILAPIFAKLWVKLGQKNMEPASPVKQALGLFLLSMGYLLIAFGVKGLAPGVKVSILWLTGLYFIHTMGELCLSPIGLSMVNKLAPVRFASLLMGVWYLSMATANKFAGALSTLYPEEGKTKMLFGIQITNLYEFFMVFVIMSAVAAIILFGLSKWLQKLMNGIR
ncbi:Amino acid/peptide transporter (Peptide:H+ symporter) [uncultured Paludibacter sp.]|uniref:Amino acid/peptide transporter (Peptide:H+ symporter) n=1 Tax=uncultured Paludibacter sp. TaxID=497635 RepID=A0A653AIT3_9BACT|nr:Amino acid/peptide transporter (Peptide:H+ symporter) [uncultured Paludibacter sp.]